MLNTPPHTHTLRQTQTHTHTPTRQRDDSALHAYWDFPWFSPPPPAPPPAPPPPRHVGQPCFQPVTMSCWPGEHSLHGNTSSSQPAPHTHARAHAHTRTHTRTHTHTHTHGETETPNGFQGNGRLKLVSRVACSVGGGGIVDVWR